MKIPPISQSLIKHVQAYSRGDFCGLLLKHVWIDGGELPSSDAMKLGQYFEYKATGALTYHGKVPKAEYTKTPDKRTRDRISAVRKWITRRSRLRIDGIGTRDAVKRWRKWAGEYERAHPEPIAPYRQADSQAANFRRYLKEWKWTLEEVAPKATRDGLKWSLDLIVKVEEGGYWPWEGLASEFNPRQYEGRKFIADLKYTGLIWNKWDLQGFGGQLSDKTHAIQARHYALYGLPVAFVVFGTNKTEECRVIPTEPENIEGHKQTVEEIRGKITAAILTDTWHPYPHYQRCRECPLKDDCKHRRLAPRAEGLQIV